jgi:hypothetical protein
MCGVGICGLPCRLMSLKPRSSLRMKRMFGACQGGGAGGQCGGGGAGSAQLSLQLAVLNKPVAPAGVHCVPWPLVVPAVSQARSTGRL